MSALVRLYPAAWRVRYGPEFETLRAFALAAARAGIGVPTRWRLVVLLTPWPLGGALLVESGLLPESLGVPLFFASLFPIGIAWIATGVRIASGHASTSMTTAGGQA